MRTYPTKVGASEGGLFQGKRDWEHSRRYSSTRIACPSEGVGQIDIIHSLLVYVWQQRPRPALLLLVLPH